MKTKIIIAILAITLAACTPLQTSTTDIQNTAVAIVQTSVALTQTALPTATFPPSTFIPTALPTSTPAATVTLTQPPIPIMITPDVIQVERWKDYEAALAKKMFPSSFIPDEFLCEWEILGRSDQEVYVWAVCMSIFSVDSTGLPYHVEMPSVIHVGVDEAVQRVEIPRGGTHYASDIRQMFPSDAQERYFSRSVHFKELTDHLRWRREHPEEPPLIALLATPTP